MEICIYVEDYLAFISMEFRSFPFLWQRYIYIYVDRYNSVTSSKHVNRSRRYSTLARITRVLSTWRLRVHPVTFSDAIYRSHVEQTFTYDINIKQSLAVSRERIKPVSARVYDRVAARLTFTSHRWLRQRGIH